MNNQLIAILFCFFSGAVFAIEVIEPQELQNSTFDISDPDQHIKTLGEVAFQIDLSASHDDLLALKVRRSNLTLKDRRPFTAFGVHKKAGVIVLAGGDVTHVSVANVEDKQGAADAQILFYGKDNKVISPRAEDVAVFDTNFKPLGFTYTPLMTPASLDIPITIALDTSGSMDGHMETVVHATKSFLAELPIFTRCRILAFNDDVYHLTPSGFDKVISCPSASNYLNKPLVTGGATALHKALYTGIVHAPRRSVYGFPNIMIVVTDGINTVSSNQTTSSLRLSKKFNNSKLFVFWAGSYQQGYLQGLADLEFVSTQNLSNELERFFHSLGVSLSGLQTLHIRRP